MKLIQQIAALIAFNLRTLPARLGSAAAAVFGIAGVVAVLVGILSISEGFSKVMTVAGSPDTAMVLRGGADSEMTSVLVAEDVNAIATAPGIAQAGGQPLVSAELFVVVDVPKRTTNTAANVPMRGVRKEAFLLRPEVKIVEGRAFAWGTNEVIVGRGAQRSFAGTEVGKQLKLGSLVWNVVGIFEANGAISESEIWADANVLAPAYRRGNTFQVAMVKLASPGSFQRFKDVLTTDPRVNVRVMREMEYFAAQTDQLRQLITFFAVAICSLMGLGAILGALNTMYTAVAARSREIATLEAIGFGGTAVLFSVVAESLILAFIGGAFGSLGAYAAFDGYRAATMNFATFSQVAFAFDVTPRLMIWAAVYAALIGLVGGFFPALRAARTPVSMALRDR
ncbi:MAG TPA: ABC transporter permease [Thermoanaerobaculia bacterium]|jgi:putative ABC transport system permease protein